jgi:hypothetical protein
VSTTPQAIGPYTVDAEIGRGGMGVVFRATDSRLGRTVAIKALPEHLADDPDRLARFEREARTLASLNHPNVAGIHGVEEHEGRRYLVLEFVEGETLAERLDRGPLALDDALEVCAQVAAGVEAAHEAGVIHRDLKPANVKITPDGRVKVLDFGLARTEDPVGSSSSMGDMPTMTTPVATPTTPGVILGTAPYMSPEQARGRRVDKRTDIWSFGVVLYECLTGESPFRGETATDSIGAILHKGVDLDRLPPNTPFLVRHLLERCLERDRGERLRDIGDARLELARARRGDAAPEHAQSNGSRIGAPSIVAGALVVGALAGAGAMHLAGGGPPPAASPALHMDLALALPDASGAMRAIMPGGVSIAPDGSAVVVDPVGGGPLVVRALDTFESRTLPGTEDADAPCFSPDGRSLVYKRHSDLFRADVRGGPPVRIYSGLDVEPNIIWIEDGSLIMIGDDGGAIVRGHIDGRAIETIARAASDRGWLGFDSIAHVPGQPYVLAGAWDDNAIDAFNIVAISLADGAMRQVMADGACPSVTLDGRMIFLRDSTLFSVPIDLARAEVTGEAVRIVDGVRADPWGGWAAYALAASGELVYLPGQRSGRGRRLARIGADGVVRPLGEQDDFFNEVTVSPDGASAVVSTLRRSMESWLIDIERASMRRLSADGEGYMFSWSPDGARLANMVLRPTLGYESHDIVVRDLTTGAPARTLIERTTMIPQDWAPGGDALIVARPVGETGEQQRTEILLVPIDDPQSMTTLLPADASRWRVSVSPDGRWIAYFSNETGGWELHLRAYPPTERVWQVSVGGVWTASGPFWSADSGALHWVDDDRMHRTTIEALDAGGVRIGAPTELFVSPWPLVPSRWEQIDITPDGDFLAIAPAPWEQDPQPLRVMTNWSVPD